MRRRLNNGLLVTNRRPAVRRRHVSIGSAGRSFRNGSRVALELQQQMLNKRSRVTLLLQQRVLPLQVVDVLLVRVVFSPHVLDVLCGFV